MSDCPMLISNKLHSFRNFKQQNYKIIRDKQVNFIKKMMENEI